MAVLLGAANPTKVGTDFEGANFTFASKFTAAATGTVDTVSLRLNSTNTYTGTLNCAVYSDNGSGTKPVTRLGNLSTITATAGASAKTSTTGMNVSVTSGTVYWIAFAGTAQFDFETSSGNGGTGGTVSGSEDISSATPPASWTTSAGTFAETISAWASDAGGVVARRKVRQTVPVMRAANY